VRIELSFGQLRLISDVKNDTRVGDIFDGDPISYDETPYRSANCLSISSVTDEIKGIFTISKNREESLYPPLRRQGCGTASFAGL
jgi:hypothetical protein